MKLTLTCVLSSLFLQYSCNMVNMEENNKGNEKLQFHSSTNPNFLFESGYLIFFQNGIAQAISPPFDMLLFSIWLFSYYIAMSSNAVQFVYRYLAICSTASTLGNRAFRFKQKPSMCSKFAELSTARRAFFAQQTLDSDTGFVIVVSARPWPRFFVQLICPSTGSSTYSPGSLTYSPGSPTYSPGAPTHSPGTSNRSSGASTHSRCIPTHFPGTSTRSSGNPIHSSRQKKFRRTVYRPSFCVPVFTLLRRHTNPSTI
uniref:Uncharacterized protein n=2 Tax=Ditylenchus dipsaci TaxID=166011 RepID=A0A915D237_9BILA